SFIDEWRALAATAVRDESHNSAVRAGMERLFLALVQSADGAPALLDQVIHLRLRPPTQGIAEVLTKEFGAETTDSITSLPLFAGERDVLSALSEVAQAQLADWTRLPALVDLLKRVRDAAGRRPVPKCLVFCGFTSTASETADELARRFGERTVARHLAHG